MNPRLQKSVQGFTTGPPAFPAVLCSSTLYRLPSVFFIRRNVFAPGNTGNSNTTCMHGVNHWPICCHPKAPVLCTGFYHWTTSCYSSALLKYFVQAAICFFLSVFFYPKKCLCTWKHNLEPLEASERARDGTSKAPVTVNQLNAPTHTRLQDKQA